MKVRKSYSFIKEKDHEVARIVNPILRILSLLVAAPLFILLHRSIPSANWPFHLDRILLGLTTLLFVLLVFKLMRQLVLLAFFSTLIGLTYAQFTNRYCFDNLYEDYRAMLYSLKDSPHPEEFIVANFTPFPNKARILDAINFQNPTVRNFSLLATTKHFTDYQKREKRRISIQCFAIFKEINSQWNYVNDPKSREYLAKASESIEHLSGDCDDHSILMAACIKSVGGTPRLIYTNKHIYPELLIGSQTDMEALNYLIREKLFKYEINNESLYYHIDEHNRIWLNLDYTAQYPGGKFLKEEILGVLNL